MPIVFISGNFTDEVFTHVPDDGGKPLTINATKLRAFIEANPHMVQFTYIHLQPENIKEIQRAFQQPKFDSLAQMGPALAAEIFSQPGLYCEMDDGSHVLVDGSHRALIFFYNGQRTVPGALIPKEVWEQFVIDIPDNLAKLMVQ